MVPGETKFVKARQYPQDFCLKLQETYVNLAKRTPNSKVLTDNKGRGSIPMKSLKRQGMEKISRGHPLGATGIGQIAEIVKQLRGEAGKQQVEGARIGMTENGGGAV